MLYPHHTLLLFWKSSHPAFGAGGTKSCWLDGLCKSTGIGGFSVGRRRRRRRKGGGRREEEEEEEEEKPWYSTVLLRTARFPAELRAAADLLDVCACASSSRWIQKTHTPSKTCVRAPVCVCQSWITPEHVVGRVPGRGKDAESRLVYLFVGILLD